MASDFWLTDSGAHLKFRAPSPPRTRFRRRALLLSIIGGLILAVLSFAAGASYQQDPGPDGLVPIEAEDLSSAKQGSGLEWQASTDNAGFSGKGSIVLVARTSAKPDEAARIPLITYRVIFLKSGTHYLWIRGAGRTGAVSIAAGVDGKEIPNCSSIPLQAGSWNWINRNKDNARAIFNIPNPGEYNLNLWARDAGTSLDRIIITTNKNWEPARLNTPSNYGLGGAYYSRVNSGEAWEAAERVGPYADVLVRLTKPGEKLVFWRGASYLPYWETREGRWYLEAIVPRKGDGSGIHSDLTNQYARADLIESTPARAVVRWRYVPDFSYPGMAGWAEEYFTVYPDGACIRSSRLGTKTLQEWEDPANRTIMSFHLATNGITPLPAQWLAPDSLSLSGSTESYSYKGFDKTQRCSVLQLSSSGQPSTLIFALSNSAGFIRNPALVIKDWGDAGTIITVDGKPFQGYQTGIVKHLNGADLVLWLKLESVKPLEVSIKPVGGSAPVRRSVVPDPYASAIPVLPEGSKDPGPFGAYYTHLRYFKEWDESWRVGPHSDVVVQFDDQPYRFVFWRGTDYVPHWANDLNHWYNNEFIERRAGDTGLAGCCVEPMQDFETRFSNVRILSSNEARAVIHWRYAPSDKNYQLAYYNDAGWSDRVDEYYTVYPDGVSVRKVTLFTSAPYKFNEWHEAIPIVNPGKTPEDVMEMNAVAMTDYEGNKRIYNFQSGFPKQWDDGKNIMLIGLKGRTKPFAVVENRGVWVDEISFPNDTRFNHYDDWPAWPADRRGGKWQRTPENNYREFWKILPGHSSLMHFMWDDYSQNLDGEVQWKTKIMLHGMTDKPDINALIPIARSWEMPPSAQVGGPGYTGGGYDKTERAYRFRKISRDPRSLLIRMEASNSSPLINLAFVIENWPDGIKASLSIDGKAVKPGPGFRQGIETDTLGHSVLVIWIRKESMVPVTVAINPQ